MGAGETWAGYAPAGTDLHPAYSAPAVLVQTSLAALWDLATRSVPRDEATGLVKRIHWVDQAVALALGVQYGSLTSQPDLGHKLRQIKRAAGPQLVNEVEDAVRLALVDLLDRGDIAVTSLVVTTPKVSQIMVALSYVNLRLPTSTPNAKRLPDNITVVF